MRRFRFLPGALALLVGLAALIPAAAQPVPGQGKAAKVATTTAKTPAEGQLTVEDGHAAR